MDKIGKFVEFFLRDREKKLEIEEKFLAPYAQRNTGNAIKRLYKEPIDERADFQLDRDKILHSRAFRRLTHKTQVLVATKGDHYRTRLTHTLEVSQISRSIAKILGLNEELTEAIALGHDIGHAPFGHIGERTLHEIMNGDLNNKLEVPCFGGFKHNYQSLHVADNLEQWDRDNIGFNLTIAVRDGILKHTGLTYKDKKPIKYDCIKKIGLKNDYPFTLEGQVVKISDDIAQTTHDLEDGYRTGIIKARDLFQDNLFQTVCSVKGLKSKNVEKYDARELRCFIIGPMVGIMINDVALQTLENLFYRYPNGNYPNRFNYLLVTFSSNIKKDQKNLQELITDHYIFSVEANEMDGRAQYIIMQLFRAYWDNPYLLPDLVLKKYFAGKQIKTYSRHLIGAEKKIMQQDPFFARVICDHIAGMTDRYAFEQYKKLYLPE